MANGWGLKQAQMNLQMKKDEKEIGAAASKKGLWGKVGSTIGTLGALALAPTGIGAVALGAIASAGSGIGGVIGAEGLTSAKNRNILSGTHKGSVFFKDDAKQLKKELGDEIITDALSTGVKTAFTAGADGDFLKNLKEGFDGFGGDGDWFKKMEQMLSSIDFEQKDQGVTTYGK